MSKKCQQCQERTYDYRFDGENGFFCDNCVQEMKQAFYDRFNVSLCDISDFSGVLLDLVDLAKILSIKED